MSKFFRGTGRVLKAMKAFEVWSAMILASTGYNCVALLFQILKSDSGSSGHGYSKPGP